MQSTFFLDTATLATRKQLLAFAFCATPISPPLGKPHFMAGVGGCSIPKENPLHGGVLSFCASLAFRPPEPNRCDQTDLGVWAACRFTRARVATPSTAPLKMCVLRAEALEANRWCSRLMCSPPTIQGSLYLFATTELSNMPLKRSDA